MNETSNLDRKGKRLRLSIGIVALLLGAATSVFMVMADVELAWRTPIFLFFFMGFGGLFQAATAT